MRYTVAMLLALGLGISIAVPAVFAAEAEHEGGFRTSITTVVTRDDAGNPGMTAGPGAGSYHFPVLDHDRN